MRQAHPGGRAQLRALAARQHGSGLVAVLLVAALLGAAGLLAQGDLAAKARARAHGRSMIALAQARAALIGYAASYAERHPGEGHGYLPCPDMANTGSTPIGACGARERGVIGRLPYRTLGLADLRDGWGHCLWYAIAGSVKHNPKPLSLNWDSPGQFQPHSAAGEPLAAADSRIAAVLFAPGLALEGQSRPPSSGRRCPGSDSSAADLAHFLDADYPAAFTAPLDVFQGTADGSPRNDLIAWISVDDLFGALRRRSDFAPRIDAVIATAAGALAARLGDDDFIERHAAPAGALLVGELPDAAALDLPAERAADHDNWRNQFRFALCADASACIALSRSDPPATEPCRGVLLFGGERVAGGPGRQARITPRERADPAQYFEGANPTHLESGIPAFAGARTFTLPASGQAASEDVIRCLN